MSRDDPEISDAAHLLVERRLLSRNVVVSLLGQALPLLAAIALLPPILRGFGTERFGLLTIVWLVVGYFSLLDLGLGRALIKTVADGVGHLNRRELAETTWTSILALAAIGSIAALLAVIATPVALRLLPVTDTLRPEAESAFYAASLSIPIVVLTSAVLGLLEANQRFAAVNLVKAPSAIFTYASPLAVLPFTTNLGVVVLVLVVGRVVTLGAFTVMVRRSLPGLLAPCPVRPGILKELLRTGTWMTASNLLAPLMLTLDRVIIAAVVSVSAVSFYATPYEVITKIWLVAGSASAVMFPAFATSARQSRTLTQRLYLDTLYYLVLVTFPLSLGAIALAPEGLSVWLGRDFAAISAVPTQILGVGVFYGGVALLAFSLVQAAGRPAIPALLQLVELPLYLIAAILATQALGLTGAALVWSIRIGADAIALVAFAQRLTRAAAWRTVGWLFVAGVALAFPAAFADRVLRLAVAGGILCAFVAVGWRVANIRMASRAFGLPSLILGLPQPSDRDSRR